jgi:hypothetical protein
MELLSRLLIPGRQENSEVRQDVSQARLAELQCISRMNEQEFASFVELANTHHVIVRAFDVVRNLAISNAASPSSTLQNDVSLIERCEAVLAAERARIDRAIGYLHSVCAALEAKGCHVAVIKSLDHWPDLGSDLDLYTTADALAVAQALRESFGAHPVARSWGDRLANKWNFNVPGLPELVEIHVQYLGQTGEHIGLARRVIERGVHKNVGGFRFLVAAPEERIVISALQRVYRHFYYRLCDMIDTAALLEDRAVDFAELRRAADSAGIWPGIATYLCLIQNYLQGLGGRVALPEDVRQSAHSPDSAVQFKGGYLRVSKATGARLYAKQLLAAGRQGDVRALLRLPLMPPLAISALVAHSLTGNDKGIW